MKRKRESNVFECEGYGHIQSECADTLKKKGKAMAATLSESENDESVSEESESGLDENLLAFDANQEDSESTCSDESSDYCEEKQ